MRFPRLHHALTLLAMLHSGGTATAWGARWDDSSVGVPLLHHYTARDTGTLAPYRCTLRTKNGTLFVGHNGLLAFDGESWRSMPVPDGSLVRSLAEDTAGRIWLGGDNLLGSLEFRADGSPVFTSASSRLPAEMQHDLGGISAVFALPQDTTVAVSENRVYWLRPNGTRVWSLPAPRRLTAWRDAEGNAYVAQPEVATMKISENGIEPAGFPEPYASTGIEWCVGFPDNSRLFGTDGRVFREAGNRVEPVTGAAADLLAQDKVTTAAPLPGGFAALATLRHGVLVLDRVGRHVSSIDRSTGLPDNRVFDLATSERHGLAITTPQAVTLLCDELSATVFSTRDGLSSRRVSSAARSQGHLLIANGPQLLQLTGPTGQWRQLLPQHERITQMLEAGGHLLAASTSGIDLVEPASGRTRSIRSGETTLIGSWTATTGGLAWVEGASLQRGRFIDGRLEPVEPPVEIEHDACSLVEGPDGSHWIATLNSGIVRVAPPEAIRAGKVAVRRYRSNLRQWGGALPELFRVGSHLLATVDGGLVEFNEAGDRFVPLPAITNAQIHAIAPAEPDGTVWLALGQKERLPYQIRIARLRAEGDNLTCELVRLPPLPLTDQPSALFAEPGEAHGESRVFWLGLPGRLLRIESPGTLAANPPVVPSIDPLAILADGRGLRSLEHHQPIVPFENTGLRFDIAVPGGRTGQRVHLETRLEGIDIGWMPLGEIPYRVFHGLQDRTYRLEARSVDAIGRTSAPAVLFFTVQAPWWRSGPAYFAYALGLVLLSTAVLLARLRLARAHRRQLEELVEQRTRELAAANSAKSEFLAHINHEIRNPLNGVIGLSAMLAQQHPDESSRQLARSLKACAGYLGSVVDNVLDLARIEAGRIEITPQRFEPRLLIEDIAEMFRLQIEDDGGRISCSADPSLPDSVVGDVHRIRQVLVNYTANAARYARGGDVRLSARLRSHEGNKVVVVFTVADTGPGIAPSEQSRIFEKFARGPASTTAETPRGYGVGLALVRELAELLGGEADVDSQPGMGAKFRLAIPLEVAASTTPPAIVARTASHHTALRALVVDDQAFNRLILRDHLERLGCKVEESADGTSGHLLLQARAHHLAFIDLDLPGMDGLTLIRRIRTEGGPRPTFLVATTAAAAKGIEEKVLAAGADAFLPKPISLPHLAALIEACNDRLSGQPPRTAAAELAPPASPSPGGLFAGLALTDDQQRSLHAELDVETQALVTCWRQNDQAAARRHAHRLISLAILARDEKLAETARDAEQSLLENRTDAGRAVETLTTTARRRIRQMGTTAASKNAGQN